MPSLFAITAPTNTVYLDDKRQGTAAITVTNTSGVGARGRARLFAKDAKVASWLTIAGDAERDFSVGGTQQYSVSIAVPGTATPGAYTFRLDMVGTENPDENLTQGDLVTFSVPALPNGHGGFPWWILLIVLALLIVIGVIVFLVLPKPAAPDPTPTPTSTSTPAPTATATPVCFVLPRGVVGSWQWEGNGNDAKGKNNAQLVNGATFAPGFIGRALKSSGANDHARVVSSTLDLREEPGLSISAWISLTSVTNQAIVEWNNGTVVGVHLWVGVQPPDGTGNGSLYANVGDVNNVPHKISTSPNLISANRFQHIALTYDRASGRARLYLNGSTQALDNNFGTFRPRTNLDLFFGIRPQDVSHSHISGLIDDVEIYNRALTDAEVQDIAQAGAQCRRSE